MCCQIESFGPDSPYLEDAVTIYASTWGTNWTSSYQLFQRHMAYPGFLGLVALIDGVVIGMGYGTSCVSGNWWVEAIKEQVADHSVFEDAWSFAKLAVKAEFRNLGVGSTLHDTLLQRQPHRQALLSSSRSNVVARKFYERKGWKYLSKVVVLIPPGSKSKKGEVKPSHVVMWKDVHKDTA